MRPILGIWKHTNGIGRSIIHDIRADDTYQTRMIDSHDCGCEQHVYHFGTYHDTGEALTLRLENGQKLRRSCSDPDENFPLRDLTEEERDAIRIELATPIQYIVTDFRLITRIPCSDGSVEIEYIKL